jgi:hypothetical protein
MEIIQGLGKGIGDAVEGPDLKEGHHQQGLGKGISDAVEGPDLKEGHHQSIV